MGHFLSHLTVYFALSNYQNNQDAHRLRGNLLGNGAEILKKTIFMKTLSNEQMAMVYGGKRTSYTNGCTKTTVVSRGGEVKKVITKNLCNGQRKVTK